MSDQDGIAALAVQVAGPVSASGGLAAAGPWESAAEELDYLIGRLSEGRTCKVLHRDAGTALLAFDGADDAFYAACVVQQGDPDAAAGARHLQVRLLLDALPAGSAESPGALAVLEGVREVPVKGLYATRRFVEALPPTLKIRFRVAGVDGNETFCGVRSGQLYESLCVEQECTAVAIATTRHAEPGREREPEPAMAGAAAQSRAPEPRGHARARGGGDGPDSDGVRVAHARAAGIRADQLRAPRREHERNLCPYRRGRGAIPSSRADRAPWSGRHQPGQEDPELGDPPDLFQARPEGIAAIHS